MLCRSSFTGRRRPTRPWSTWQLCSAVIFALNSLASAQLINNWTNPASAHWEDMYLSLGVLPGATQNVYVTNRGYKAVGIFDTTVASNAGNLTISNLTLSAPDSA